MITTTEYNFKVTTLRAGQPRPYADSEYEYEIETNCGEFAVKIFCTRIIHGAKYDYSEWEKSKEKDYAVYFTGYYKLTKTGENTWKYYVFEPYCD